MKLLIAVKSCHRFAERGYHEVIRNTWGKHVAPAELMFFVGSRTGGSELPCRDYGEDCQRLDVPDDYDSIPLKSREIMRWSIQHNYDHIFVCDTDTFVLPQRLLNCGFQNYDYAGRFQFGKKRVLGTTFDYKDDGRGNRIERCYPWTYGGFGYFLSRKAASILILKEPDHWADDFWIGQSLGPLISAGTIKGYDIPKYERNISWHFPKKAYGRKPYDPSFGWMEKMYRSFRLGEEAP